MKYFVPTLKILLTRGFGYLKVVYLDHVGSKVNTLKYLYGELSVFIWVRQLVDSRRCIGIAIGH